MTHHERQKENKQHLPLRSWTHHGFVAGGRAAIAWSGDSSKK